MSIDSAEPLSVAVIIPVVRPEQRAAAEAVVRSLADLAELAVLDNAEGEPASADATWLRAGEVVPAHGAGQGRGEAIWKGLFATRGKVVVVIAPETPDPAGVLRAVTAPFAADDSLGMVCGVGPTEAEVTRLLARPLLALHAPQLADLRDPTSQEWAVRRDLVEMLPLSVGAGVDLALRLDVENLEGRAADPRGGPARCRCAGSDAGDDSTTGLRRRTADAGADGAAGRADRAAGRRRVRSGARAAAGRQRARLRHALRPPAAA